MLNIHIQLTQKLGDHTTRRH